MTGFLGSDLVHRPSSQPSFRTSFRGPRSPLPARAFEAGDVYATRRGPAQSAHSTDPHQRLVLRVAAVHRAQDFSAALAFVLRSDVADHLIYGHRISGFIEPPNGDPLFACFHTPMNASG